MDNFQRYLTPDTGFLNPLKNQILAGLNEDLIPDISHLSEQLHASLDLTRVLQTFTREAANFVQLSGMRFQCESTCIETENFAQGIYEHITELSHNQQTLGYITYAAFREIGPKEAKVLHHMQSKLAQPVKHALHFAQLQQQALKDYLTKLGNRASFDEQIELAIERCERNSTEISLVLLDLDNFKFANDNFGHIEGDKVLQEFASIIKQSVRKTDIAFRFGGDEFAIILDTDNPDVAIQVANRIHTLMSQSEIMLRTCVSSSIGYAHWENGESSLHLFSRADEALYLAKHNQKAKQLKRA
ncbi:GGDEF domain-containing protein [Catenovulum sp. 2E275]|uniref:GGDEF domain-containing protein n=1 Tax=Catenovulum sp. 2E275 TaxID=2980497 RepID=UPI0021CEB5E1|nr:GGDEF domain-containing protein [Catenovulum sp. 2E275]MCU4676078.1 GGDEF domain-containing protein [Catenovulum sp. 2E275]